MNSTLKAHQLMADTNVCTRRRYYRLTNRIDYDGRPKTHIIVYGYCGVGTNSLENGLTAMHKYNHAHDFNRPFTGAFFIYDVI